MSDKCSMGATTTFSRLALYIIAAGWVGFVVYLGLFFLVLDPGVTDSLIKHFLSYEHSAIRYRALVFFLPLICTVIGFLVNEREKAYGKTILSEQRYRDLFENANDPIFVLDAELNYLDANRKAVEMFGFEREELLRMNIRDLVPAELVPEQVTGEITCTDDLSRKFVTRMRTNEGQWRDIEVSASAIVVDNCIVGYREIIRDVSELKRVQDELNEAYYELEMRVMERTSELYKTKRMLIREIDERKKIEAAMEDLLKKNFI